MEFLKKISNIWLLVILLILVLIYFLGILLPWSMPVYLPLLIGSILFAFWLKRELKNYTPIPTYLFLLSTTSIAIYQSTQILGFDLFFKTHTVFNFIYLNLIYFIFITLAIYLLLINKNNEIKNERKNIALYFFIFTLALIIRIYNLGYLTPYTDEFYHLLAAKRFLSEGVFNYPRAPFITIITAFLFKLTGTFDVGIARLPGVLIGSLAPVILYALAKKINQNIALISALLFIYLPVAIGISRSVREYPYFNTVMILFLYLQIKLFFSKIEKKIKILLFLTFYSIPLIYFLLIDTSNFVLQLYILLLFSFITLYIYSITNNFTDFKKIFYVIKNNKTIVFSSTLIIISSVLFIIYKASWLLNSEFKYGLFNLPEMNYFKAIFDPSFHPWNELTFWYTGSNYPSYFIFAIFLLSFFVYYRNVYFIIYLTSFLLILITFLYFVDTYFAIRYVSYSFPFLTIIFASTIELLYKIKNLYKNTFDKIIYLLSVTIIILTIFNPASTYKSITQEQIGLPDPKTVMVGYNYQDLFNFLSRENFKDGDTIITSEGLREALPFYFNKYYFLRSESDTSLYRLHHQKDGKLTHDLTTIYTYYYLKPYYSEICTDQVCNMDEFIRLQKIISSKKNGWIIIDKDRNRNWNKDGFPIHSFIFGDILIKYIGSTDGYRGFDIYNWGY